MKTQGLEVYPHPAMLSDGAVILALNEKAQVLFPGLKPGSDLPDALLSPEGEQSWEGVAALEGRLYQISCRKEAGESLYLFQPREQQALTQGQLDGALYQLRTLMGQFHRELGPCVRGEQEQPSRQNMDDFARSFDRMVRLMDHLDFLRDAQEAEMRLGGRDVEFGRFCGMVAVECDGLLREMGIRVEFTAPPAPVVVRVDEVRLRDALTELISNCARRITGGSVISMGLTVRGGRAVLCVTDDGAAATARQRLGLTARGAAPLIPTPDMGAGLGLSVAEKTVWLHGGALLFSTDAGAPRAYLSLPITRGKGADGVQSPVMERNAGRSPYVIALSDVLPGEIIREDWKE